MAPGICAPLDLVEQLRAVHPLRLKDNFQVRYVGENVQVPVLRGVRGEKQ